MLPFWYPGEKQEGHEGVQNQIFIEWGQFWDTPPPQKPSILVAKPGILSFDGSVIILSRRETRCCNFKSFTHSQHFLSLNATRNRIHGEEYQWYAFSYCEEIAAAACDNFPKRDKSFARIKLILLIIIISDCPST